jgi:hypothetical protein
MAARVTTHNCNRHLSYGTWGTGCRCVPQIRLLWEYVLCNHRYLQSLGKGKYLDTKEVN